MTGREKEDGGHPDEEKLFFSGPDKVSSEVSLDKPGTLIGRYKILSLLGEGGYGLVYLAEQQQPVRRQIALKIVKPGMDSKEILARFEAERQALALLDHPNIAKIFDAGSTDAGRPYFVMEHIDGLPITEYCDNHRLTIEERLRVFVKVCEAVQHAHQKGIIHRDIKPTNILVCSQDGQAVPKIIDFGVAKAIGQPLTEKTLFTARGQLVGTPEYMSPEQVDLASRDIDTRSDVYSLGAVLYELVTGALPFEAETLRGSGIEKMRQTIRKQDPLRPSTRLSRLGDEAHEIARNRRTDKDALTRCIRRELEWIPLKAMCKERAERYRSASELADDIQNYLAGAPLIAGPESTAYRIKKVLRTHRAPVATGAVILATLLVGLIVSTAMYFRAEKMRAEADRSQIDEANQRSVAEKERDRATEAEQRALATLADLYEEQGRKYMDSGSFDEALLVLSEAYQIDNTRSSIKFLLTECLRRHDNPVFGGDEDVISWGEELGTPEDMSFAVNPDRKLIAFVNQDEDSIAVFDTGTGALVCKFLCPDVVQLAFGPTSNHIVAKAEMSSANHILKVFDLENIERVFSIERNNVDADWLHSMVDPNLTNFEQVRAVFDSIYMVSGGDWFVFADLAEGDNRLKQTLKSYWLTSGRLYTSAEEHFNSLILQICLKPESPYGFGEKLLTLDSEGMIAHWTVPTLSGGTGFDFKMDSGIFGSRGITCIGFKGSNAILMDRYYNRKISTIQGVSAAGYSPDEKYFITKKKSSAAYEGQGSVGYSLADLWESATGRHVAALGGSELSNWHFTLDSKHLVTEHQGGQIKVWRVEDGSSLFAIPSQEPQIVADISADSTKLLTCGVQEPHVSRIWNLQTGDWAGPYENIVLETDISAGFLTVSIDRIFAYSHRPPKQLLRFNSDGSHLITGAGLRPLVVDVRPPAYIRSLVHAHVPRRTEAGRLRPASTGEMLLAKYDYHLPEDGKRHRETITAALDVIVHEIQSGKLQKAPELAKDLRSLPPSEEELGKRVDDVIRQLSSACYTRADRHERQGKYAGAMADYELAHIFCDTDPRILNELSWLQATCPDKHLRDLRKAKENARRACELTDWKSWEYLSTYAVSCAQTGEFTDATRFQEKALALMPESESSKWKANYEQRLKQFHLRQGYARGSFLNVPSRGLVGWWRFDKLDGKVALDESGNEYDGMLRGTPQRQPGKIGAALRYNGEDNYVDIDKSPAFDIVDAITVTAWIQADPRQRSAFNRTIIGKARCWEVTLHRGTNVLGFACHGLDVPSLYPEIWLKGKKMLEDSCWHHIAAVYDGDTMLLYVDGSLDTSVPASGRMNTTNDQVQIGSAEGSAGFNGLIDDVRIYNRALSSKDIAQLYDDTK